MSATAAIAALTVEHVTKVSYVLSDEDGIERASMVLGGIVGRAEIVTPNGIVVAAPGGLAERDRGTCRIRHNDAT